MSGEARDSVRQSARPVIELGFGILVYRPRPAGSRGGRCSPRTGSGSTGRVRGVLRVTNSSVTEPGLQAEVLSAPHSHPKTLRSRPLAQVTGVMIRALRSRERASDHKSRGLVEIAAVQQDYLKVVT